MSPGQCVTYVPGLYIANRPYHKAETPWQFDRRLQDRVHETDQ